VAQPAATNHHISFHDVLSALNPLQYLPVVGTIYRAVTGDQIPEAMRRIGSLAMSTLIGGPIGFITNIATTIAEKLTGIDLDRVGQTLLASIGAAGRTADPPAVDPAAQPTEAATAAAAAAPGDPNATGPNATSPNATSPNASDLAAAHSGAGGPSAAIPSPAAPTAGITNAGITAAAASADNHPETKPASASVAPAAATGPAAAAAAQPWSPAQLAAYGVATSGNGTLKLANLTGADVLNSLELTRIHDAQAAYGKALELASK
jgi:hypothetical protein